MGLLGTVGGDGTGGRAGPSGLRWQAQTRRADASGAGERVGGVRLRFRSSAAAGRQPWTRVRSKAEPTRCGAAPKRVVPMLLRG